jgi:hypothetical protein
MDKSTIDAQIRQNAIKILGLRNPPQLREGTPRVQILWETAGALKMAEGNVWLRKCLALISSCVLFSS